ncbi:MAG: hypothetical protein JRH01_04500 [Deltaproteobacteria bacterium]|nr:hypothetical protein [Deltaproteobacteria bacterium]
MPSRILRIRGRRRAICSIAVVALLSASAAGGANLIDVRVGVHKDYSRVVFQLDGVSPYRLAELRPTDDARLVLVVALDAAGGKLEPIKPAGSRHIRAVRIRGGPDGSRVNIVLRGDVEMKELVLRKPDRIVLDFYDPGAGVASLVSGLVATTVADAPTAEPAAEPVAPSPLESGELAAVSQPIEPEPVAEAASEMAAMPAGELSEAPEESFQEAEAGQGEPEVLEGEVLGTVPDEFEPADAPDDAYAGVEIGEVVAEEPVQQMPQGLSPEPTDGQSSGSLLGSRVGMAALAGLALVGLLFVLGRRRRSDPGEDTLSPLDAADDTGPVFAEGTEDQSDAEAPEVVAEPVVEESALPPAGEHDIEPGAIRVDEVAGEAVVEGTPMDQEMDYPAPAGAGAGFPAAPLAAMGSNEVGTSDVAKIVEEFDRRIAHLENRLEEVVDAKERLERQVSAQTEELRVQRAAIARTQRVLRTIARPEEESNEPAPKL